MLDVDNGARFETYTIAGARGSGEIKINGAAARLVHTGDTVIVVSYAEYDEAELETYEPRVVHVNADNADHHGRRRRRGAAGMSAAPRMQPRTARQAAAP